MKLYFQRKLRQFAIYFNHVTENWVVPRDAGLCHLIENTDKPDFEKYYKELQKFEDRWKIYDHYLESFKVSGRLFEFKHRHKIKKP